MKESRSKPEK